MPPILASCLTIGFIVWLFRRDFREKADVTGALWLPFLWVVISGSRFVSQWLALFGFNVGGVSVEEGSPVDATFFFGIIGAGVYVLHQRRVSWMEFARHNRWVTIYLAYCLLAIAWSDFPLSGFKRWIKLFGQPVMVLILLTEPDPMEALRRLLKRCAYVLIPVSILFIKYYPEYGRGFDLWTGEGFNTGITTDKNALGYDCMVLGLFFFWHLVQTWATGKGRTRRNELMLTGGFLCMIWWLITMAHSATALMTCLLGILIVVLLGRPIVNRRVIGTYLIVGTVVIAVLELAFGLSGLMLELLGKEATLTGRTEVWAALVKWDINPVLGAGYESFWLGDRLEQLGELFWWRPNQAHNGYLETYLNLGLVGVVVTIGMIIATFFKARHELLKNFEFGRFRLAYLIAFVVYNWTEGAFRTHAVPFFVFFLIAVDYPRRALRVVTQSRETVWGEEDRELVHTSVGAFCC